MAGTTILETSELPDFHQTMVIQLNATDAPADQAIFYAERDTVVETVYATCATSTSTYKLKVGSTDLTSSKALSTSFEAATVIESANIIPEGSSLTVDFNAPTNVDRFIIQLRIRTRIG